MTNFPAGLKNKEKQKQILRVTDSKKDILEKQYKQLLNDTGTMNLTTKTMPTPQITAGTMFSLLIN